MRLGSAAPEEPAEAVDLRVFADYADDFQEACDVVVVGSVRS